ncbi:hypothetical protein D9619_003585 [Psilocybe cf. subviscida]|uniref:Sm domain-containing protein n=1 Tax=Psilocybe cf. subviscida TaxID=2480587 RepID=A0A8H5EUX4_9AGAR|nr:hypothetical protein D9619_003585 [Psilocybe cf. subviscida]
MASSSPPPPPSPTASPPSSVSSPEQPTETNASSLDAIRGLLRELLRITVTDGRVFIGTFAGTDKPLNILLINAEEYRIGPGEDPDGRYVGQIMIPWKVIVKVEAHVPPPQPAQVSRGDSSMYI